MRHPALHCKNPETDLIVFTDSALEASTIVIYSARWFVEDQYICFNLYVVQIFELPIHHITRKRIECLAILGWAQEKHEKTFLITDSQIAGFCKLKDA